MKACSNCGDDEIMSGEAMYICKKCKSTFCCRECANESKLKGILRNTSGYGCVYCGEICNDVNLLSLALRKLNMTRLELENELLGD